MRAFMMGALGALALLVLPATTASASSYGWPTSYSGAEWMNDNIGRATGSYFDGDEAPQRKGRRSARSGSSKRDAAARPSRRLPAVSYSDVGTGRGSSGLASYYWQPQRVASGGWFNPNAMTAAHKTLPFGTKVRVTNASTGRSVTVTINDRGPYVAGRVIDLSSAAAGAIGMKSAGVARVHMSVLGR